MAEEQDRLELLRRLEEALGADAARTLLERLPPMSWHELARSEDLLALKTDVEGVKTDVEGVKADVVDLKVELAEMRGEWREFKAEFRGFREQLDQRLVGMEERLTAKIVTAKAEIMADMRGELVTTVVGQNRLVIVSMIATVGAFGGLIVALGQLAGT